MFLLCSITLFSLIEWPLVVSKVEQEMCSSKNWLFVRLILGESVVFAQHRFRPIYLYDSIIFHFYFSGASRNRYKSRRLLKNDLSSLELSPDLLINLRGSTMVWPLVDFLNITITRTESINLVNFFQFLFSFIQKIKKEDVSIFKAQK